MWYHVWVAHRPLIFVSGSEDHACKIQMSNYSMRTFLLSCAATFWIRLLSIFFSCDQAALRTFLSVRPSVRLSHLFHYVPIIVSSWNFQEWLPMKDIHAKCQGQRSKVKVTEVKTQLSRFRTVTAGWIPGWLWNDAQSLKWHRRGALLFFEIICQISRSHGAKNRRFWPKFYVSGL